MSSQDGKKGFVIYDDYLEHVELMSMEQRGVFLTALLKYSAGLDLPGMDDVVKMAFSFAKAQIDRDVKKYQRISEKRREYGRRGGMKSGENKAETDTGAQNEANEAKAFFAKQNEANASKGKQNISQESFAKQTEAKPSHTDTDTDTDTDTETITDTDTGTNTDTGTDINKNILFTAGELFERLWQLYPNKKGKGKITDSQKKKLLAVGEPAMVKAIERYISELKKDGWRNPQNGDTFFRNGYIDYLDENFVPSADRPTSGSAYIDNISNRLSVVDEWLADKERENQEGQAGQEGQGDDG